MDPIDSKLFWSALGSRACGVAVVTARGREGPAGFMALSMTHLTASPPTVMVSISETTSALPVVMDAGHFAINFLSSGQKELVDVFSGRTDRKGADRFEADLWSTLKTGAPALNEAVGVIDCELQETITRHGTVIALGTVVGFSSNAERTPLVSFRGGYKALAD